MVSERSGNDVVGCEGLHCGGGAMVGDMRVWRDLVVDMGGRVGGEGWRGEDGGGEGWGKTGWRLE